MARCAECSTKWHGPVLLGVGGCADCLKVRYAVVDAPSESRDGTGSGDHDTPFAFGHPKDCLTTMCQARLLIMRGYVKDHRGAIEGDSDDFVPRPSGLLVPIATHWSEDS